MRGADAPVPLLETVGVRRTFGGLVAVDDVYLRLLHGEIRGLIGPNGAGKSTLAGLIAGRHVPDSGRILLEGRDITRRPGPDRVRLGIAMAFQIPAVFGNLTVFENVAAAAQRVLLRRPLDFLGLSCTPLVNRVAEALERVGLQEVAHEPAGHLPYGHQRLVEIAMVLALRPRLVILDEPSQGLTPDEIAHLTALVRTLAREATVLLIEHNLPMVLELSHRITVMDGGRILFEGTPAEVEADSGVQRVYLGAGG